MNSATKFRVACQTDPEGLVIIRDVPPRPPLFAIGHRAQVQMGFQDFEAEALRQQSAAERRTAEWWQMVTWRSGARRQSQWERMMYARRVMTAEQIKRQKASRPWRAALKDERKRQAVRDDRERQADDAAAAEKEAREQAGIKIMLASAGCQWESMIFAQRFMTEEQIEEQEESSQWRAASKDYRKRQAVRDRKRQEDAAAAAEEEVRAQDNACAAHTPGKC